MTLIIYLFHFSCVIVPIFYTKLLRPALRLILLYCRAFGFEIYFLKILCFFFFFSFFEVSYSLVPHLTCSLPYSHLLSLCLSVPQALTTSSQLSTHRSLSTCVTMKADTTMNHTPSTPCMGKFFPHLCTNIKGPSMPYLCILFFLIISLYNNYAGFCMETSLIFPYFFFVPTQIPKYSPSTMTSLQENMKIV